MSVTQAVMRYALLGTILLITASDAWAEHRPAATWEGEVNGTAVLILQGDRIDVDSRSADLVSRTSYRFSTPLTGDSGRVTVENRQGGGRVRVIEQPDRNNNFTAVVEIASRSRGSQFMSLDFYWNDERSISRDNGRYRDDSYTRPNQRLWDAKSNRRSNRQFCRNGALVWRCG